MTAALDWILARLAVQPEDAEFFVTVFAGSLASHVCLSTALYLMCGLSLRQSYRVAYELVCIPAFLYLGVTGWRLWMDTEPPVVALNGTEVFNVSWGSPEFYVLVNAVESFYLFDFFVALVIDPTMTLHHVLMILMALVCKKKYCCYFVHFFGGICELSNVPLKVFNIFRILPDLKRKMPTLEKLSMLVFGLMFYVLRIGWWGYASYQLVRSAEAHIAAGMFDSQAVAVSRFGSVSLAVFTVMQVFWGYKIGRKALRMLGGKKASGKKD
eukprot:scaffold5359_cov265-Pinguiococcus_pyrenoidosus.AAC.5